MKSHFRVLFCALLMLALPHTGRTQPQPSLDGAWELIPGHSIDIDHFRSFALTIRSAGPAITVVQTWKARQTFKDSVTLVPGGKEIDVPLVGWVNPTNVYMGMRRPEGSKRSLSARYEDGGRTLVITEKLSHQSSQGIKPVTVGHRYSLTKEKDMLEYRVIRSTRKTGPEMNYTFKKAGTRTGYVIRLKDDFTIPGDLSHNAMMISLQGLANKTSPLVYLLYPADWPFNYVSDVFDFYKNKRFFTFTELRTTADALKQLGKYAKGYVVWDKDVRTSLIVAYTVAGLEEAVVVSKDEIPYVEAAGLKPVEDFRGKFTGMSDIQIYTWAHKEYWARCSREYIVWLGGEQGTMMRPGVADWGIKQRVFFNDLSTRNTDTAEYALSRQLLSEMKPMSMVMGWHSYKKDLEEEHVALTSSFGHRVEGLNSLPNLSFSSQIQTSPGFVYRNNHHVKPGEKIQPKEKVYVACIETDGLGLGGWLKPGRGEIPYAWECLMNYSWIAPGMVEYFYTTATPNDYMIGCLSGPGYLYPKAVPPEYLKKLIAMAREQMKILDLRVFETMDWSEGDEVWGNTDLTQKVIDMYYEGMPEAIGFVNGYGAGYTYYQKEGRPLLSFDYYLSPHRPEADAVSDLQELAALNSRRPYFLLVHVREYSDVKRVKGILEKLGSEFEVVPLDVFLTMAGAQPTFENRVLKDRK